MLFCVNGSLFLCVNFSRLFPIHQLNDRAWPRIFYSQRQNTISRPQFLQVAWRGANAPQIGNCGLEAQLRDGLERCPETVQVRLLSGTVPSYYLSIVVICINCNVKPSPCPSLQLIIVFVNAVAVVADAFPPPQRTTSDSLQ